MTISGYKARVINVKVAFLKGELKENREIYMKIPEGFKEFYPQQDSLLQIKKSIYGLNNQDCTTHRKLYKQCKPTDSK